MPDAAPPALRREHDLSFTLAGPLLEDMAWVFANFRYNSLGRRAPFTYWTDPLGVRHFVYDYNERDISGTLKLSMNVLDKFKGVIEVRLHRPRRARLRPGRRQASARGLDPQPRRRGHVPGADRRELRRRPGYADRPQRRIREVQAASPPQRGRGRQAPVLRRHLRPRLRQRLAERSRKREPHEGRGVPDPPPGRSSRHVPRARRGRRVRNDVHDLVDLEVRQSHLQLRRRQPLHVRADRLADLRRRGRLGPRRVLYRPLDRGQHVAQARAQADRPLRPGHDEDRRPPVALRRPAFRPFGGQVRAFHQGRERQFREHQPGQHAHRPDPGLQPLQLGQSRRLGQGHRLEHALAARRAELRSPRQRPDDPQGLLGQAPRIPRPRLFPGPGPGRPGRLPRFRLVRRERGRHRQQRRLRSPSFRTISGSTRASSSARPSTPTSPRR